MQRKPWVALVGAGVAALFLCASSASGFVLEAKTDAQKHRRDIGKQLSKYIFCLGKAGIKCEKKGAHTGPECDLTDGSTESTIDAKTAGGFTADIAKCDGGFVAEKKQKTSSYQQIGCPGDCDPADGIQQCANLAAYDANITDGSNTSGAKFQISLLGGIVSQNCKNFITGVPGGTSANEDALKCGANDAKRLAKYAKGLNKCTELCENDYKNKKGNGGPNDDPVCDPTTAAGVFAECLTKKADKQLDKVIAPGNVGLAVVIDAALNDAAQDLFNKDDPTTIIDVNVCGTCGDGTREGSEECDGGDDALCPASCNSDCTCP